MSYVIKAVARPLEGEASVRIVGEYEDYDTAVRQRRAMDERCRVARGIILDYADIEFPVVRFTVEDGKINNESDKKPTVEEIAVALRDDVQKNHKVFRVHAWKEIVEFIRDNGRKTMSSCQDYIDFYYDNTCVYSSMHDYLDSELNDSASFTAYQAKIDEFESAIKSGYKKILSNGEIIEII